MLTWKSGFFWAVIVTLAGAAGPNHSLTVVGATMLLLVAIRYRWLSRLENWLSSGFFPPRRRNLRGQYRYRRGGSTFLLSDDAHFTGSRMAPRRSAREYSSDRSRDQVVSATIQSSEFERGEGQTAESATEQLALPATLKLSDEQTGESIGQNGRRAA